MRPIINDINEITSTEPIINDTMYDNRVKTYLALLEQGENLITCPDASAKAGSLAVLRTAVHLNIVGESLEAYARAKSLEELSEAREQTEWTDQFNDVLGARDYAANITDGLTDLGDQLRVGEDYTPHLDLKLSSLFILAGTKAPEKIIYQ